MSKTLPELSERDRLARQVAAFGLNELNGEVTSIPPEEWPLLLPTLYQQRLTGFAAAAAEAGSLTLSSEQAEELLERHREAMLQVLALERHLVTLSEALEKAGVQMILLKGSALAHTVYPDASWRPFADLDFLVRGNDFQLATEVLADMGFHRSLPEPRARFDVRFGKAAELAGPAGLMVDLHRTLVVGPFGLWIDLDELFTGTAPLNVGGRLLHRLDDESLFLHACIHASLGWWPPLLMPVRDVAQVASFGDVDWDLVAARTRRWRLAAVVRHALTTASDFLGASFPQEAKALKAIPSRRSERRALDAYITNKRQRGGTAISTIRAIPGLPAKIAYARALLFPDRAFLSARQRNERGSYLRRMAVPIRWIIERRRRVS